MFGLGPTEVIIILAIALLLFGAGNLPKIGEGMGKAISNFRKSVRDPKTEKKNALPDG